MVTYIFQRLFSILVSLFGVSLLVFFMVHLIPGDAALAILGERASEESLAKLRQEMGLNLPLYQQYGKYLWDLIHFNLGRSFRTNQLVVDDLVRYFPATVELTLASMIFAVFFGISAGVFAQRRRRGLPIGRQPRRDRRNRKE